jgi:hypothetical protein
LSQASALRADALFVQMATKMELAVNLGTATALGLKVPPSLLLRADRIAEQAGPDPR